MHRACLVGLIALCVCTGDPSASWGAAASQRTGKGIAAMCANHEAEIRRLVAAGKPVQAIAEAAQYEADLHACSPAPTFKQGRLVSQSQRVSFTVPFAAKWKLLDQTDAGRAVAAVGVEVAAVLAGPSEDERLVVTMFDVDVLGRSTGFADMGNTPAKFRQTARQAAEHMGVVRSSRAEQVRGMDTIRMEIGAEDSLELLAVRHERRIYYFACRGPSDAPAGEMDRRTDQCLAELAFADPAEAVARRIAAIHDAAAKNPSVEAFLAAVRELATMGEFHEAIIEASNLRSALTATLPKPRLVGNDLSYPEYGVLLKNPDAQRWKAQAGQVGNFNSLGLIDQTSVDELGIQVMVVDPLVMLGPMGLDSLGPKADEEEARGMLRSMGRGALTNIGTNLEGEQFAKFQGRVAYEGTVTLRAVNAKAKVIAIRGSRAIYMTLLIATPEKLPEYEKVLAASLKIDDPPARK